MSFTEHNVNGLIFDTSDTIFAAGGVVHAFTTRHGGVSPAPFDSLNLADHHGDSNENLLEIYRRLGAAVGVDASRAVACCSPTGRTAASSRSTTPARAASARCTPAGAARRAASCSRPP